MSAFLDTLAERVLLADGAMGTQVQARDLDIERDYLGCENCTEVLINKRAAELAREAVDDVKADGRPRFVLGAVGPGTKLPSLGQVDYLDLEAALAVQCGGLTAGGIDAFLIETCQDPLQIKAAVNAAKRARADSNKDTPIIVQVTVETTGTLLVGSDIAAAATIVGSLDVPMIGLNCATGPQEMAEHVKWLGESWPGLISVLPNAGLPELVDGETCYPLAPDELASWLERFVVEDGVNMIGGCCGTTAEHIAALDAMLRDRAGSADRPAPVHRTSTWVPSLASLYGQVPLKQEQAYLSIGERCNANGSRKFRQLQEAADWEGCVAMGREQVAEGSHALDLCTAFVGRDELAEMSELVGRLRGAATAPLVFDSTELPVLEAALALYGGKGVINSINFEDGEAPAAARLALAKRFGAAVIALTIDEDGMAKEAARKVEIGKRLADFACGNHGLPPSDLILDPLTFTICTGNTDDRKLGLWTLDAIERLREALPEVQLVLGVSNISFGLNPACAKPCPRCSSSSGSPISPSASTRRPARCSTRCSSTRPSSAA
jgi:5-methyltetrahydrofolate--homocysteine methyltransferase